MMKCFPCVASLGLGDAADEVMEKKKKNDGEDGAVRKKEPSAPPTSRLGSLGKKIRIIDARPLFKDRRKFPKMADPLLKGRYPMRGLYQALAVGAMCLQEHAATRPLIGDVVTALSYLASQNYDPIAASIQNTKVGPSIPSSTSESGDQHGVQSPHQNSSELKQRAPIKGGSKGAKVGRDGSSGGSGQKWSMEESETQESRMDSPVHVERGRDSRKNIDSDFVRERAVAEAKEWGENWRERQRRNAQGSSDRTHE
ncbi:hypothetical protein GW17_00007396 [Ensete ventricosum]|nr:hypothetical protein GW17_00007396 [Ensete ventricosum]